MCLTLVFWLSNLVLVPLTKPTYAARSPFMHRALSILEELWSYCLFSHVGMAKDQPELGQLDRNGTVDPLKWAFESLGLGLA